MNMDLHFNQWQKTALTLLQSQGWSGISAVCELLRAEVPHYHWVGIYWMNKAEQALRRNILESPTAEAFVARWR
jgi:putative methionine-R-sulfoxide reductase with GAF domain